MTRYDFCSKYNDDGLSIVAKGGKFGVYNFYEEKEIISPKYEKVCILDADLFAVKSFDGWGVLSKDNETILPMMFQEIWDYNDYIMAKDHKNQYFLVAKKDQRVASARYQKIYAFDGDYAVVKKNNLLGLINRDLKELISPQYNGIDYFKDNLFFVTKNNELSIVDSNNTHKLSLGYERIERLFDTPYFIVKKNGLFGLFDENLKWILPAKYIGINYLFDDYFQVTQTESAIKDVHGIFSVKKGFVLKPKYIYISYLGDNLFSVQYESGMRALFNHKGEQLTGFIYDQLMSFNGNIFTAVPAKDNPDELVTGLIDKRGQTLIEPIYDNIESKGSCYVVYKDNKCGIIDSTYKLISDIVFDEVHGICEKTKIGKKIAEIEYDGMLGNFYW